MNNVQEDIISWLHSQQDWLQKAAQMILKNGSLTEKDICELSKYLKTAKGRAKTTHRNFGSIGAVPVPKNELRLIAIGEIQGIENLSPRQPLSFGDGKLTVIYGHNGSGKSGYTRILKRVCGKPRAPDLKPNVFKSTPAKRSCKITCSLNGKNQEVEWQANSSPIEKLNPVDIYDAGAGDIYLNTETEATYIPEAIALFEELAGGCDRIRAKLQEERDQLVSKLPEIPEEFLTTRAGKTYQCLESSQTESDLNPIIYWTDIDQKKFNRLTERLTVTDPAALARQKRAQKNEIDQILTDIRETIENLSQTACKNISEERKDAKNKREIAKEAAKVITASDDLEGIGNETWRTLWEAARVYSTEEAYPGQPFPVTEKGTKCVLCHQELDPDAGQRLRDFEEYVQGKAEKEADKAEKSYQKVIDELPTRLTDEEIKTQFAAAGLSEEDWLKEMQYFWQEVSEKAGTIRKCCSEETITGLKKPTALIKSLSDISKALEKEAKQHEIDAKNFDRRGIEKELLELQPKRWTSQQATAIRREIDRLDKVKKFKKWIKLAHPRRISNKAGEISEKIITEDYIKRFNTELNDLNAARIKVKLVRTGVKKGRGRHRVQLKGVKAEYSSQDLILSDGERGVVALAAFLADVTAKPDKAPFVLDDPISSLDQDFEWAVAMRLAKLAKDRQVLVFTHRLSLYGSMEEAATKMGFEKRKDFNQRCIETFGGFSGQPVDEKTWNANTGTANNILITRLGEAKKYWDNGDSDNYNIHAQSICTDFRKLLERTIEDDLLNMVVRRHRRTITTDNRITDLSKISKDDCKFFDDLMTKYSCYEHSQSQETPVITPDEAGLRKDLEALKKWREEHKKKTVDN